MSYFTLHYIFPLRKVQEENTPGLSCRLPGLHWKNQKEDRRDLFKSWEDWEREGRLRLRDVFGWKTVNKQEKPVLAAVTEGADMPAFKTERAKSMRGVAKKLDTKCGENVDRVVLKVLQRKKITQGKKRNKEAVTETKNSAWRGVRDIVSETPVPSKAQKRTGKKRRFAEVRHFFSSNWWEL